MDTESNVHIYGIYSKLNVFVIINPILGKSHFRFTKRLIRVCFNKFLNIY